MAAGCSWNNYEQLRQQLLAEQATARQCVPLRAAPLRTSLPRGVPDALLTPNLRRQFVRKAPV